VQGPFARLQGSVYFTIKGKSFAGTILPFELLLYPALSTCNVDFATPAPWWTQSSG